MALAKKTLVLGDIHGLTVWRSIVEKEKPDCTIFLGDYFDPYSAISPADMLDNMYNIIKFAKDNEVVLLLGNHDFHYLDLYPETNYCSRHDPINAELYKRFFKDHLELFKVCHLDADILYSHAGISEVWVDIWNVDESNLERHVNQLLFERPTAFVAYYNRFLDGPFWIRPTYLEHTKPLEGYRHIVGHTNTLEDNNISKTVYFNDKLPNSYIIVENGVIDVRKNEI